MALLHDCIMTLAMTIMMMIVIDQLVLSQRMIYGGIIKVLNQQWCIFCVCV